RRPAHPGGQRPAVPQPGRGRLAPVRSRRAHGDAARGGQVPGRDPEVRRDRQADLPTRRGDDGGRPGDGRRRPVRALPGRRRLRHAQHARPRARQALLHAGRDDGRRRQLGDRAPGQGRPRRLPELSVDPVVAGSALVMALQTIVARNVSPQSRAVVTVGAFLAGNAGNVVADSAVLRLSIRTTTDADRELVLGKVRALTAATAQGFGCTYEVRESQPGAVLVNDPEETRRAYDIARQEFGEDQVEYPG